MMKKFKQYITENNIINNNKYLDYYKEIFGLFLNEIPSDDLIMYGTSFDNEDYDEEKMTLLQDFCSYNTKIEWTTGVSIIEAAENMLEDAINNGNIK